VTLENLIGKGLQREPASAEEIHRFLARIATRLADAQKDTISLDSRFDLAYEALLQIGPSANQAETVVCPGFFEAFMPDLTSNQMTKNLDIDSYSACLTRTSGAPGCAGILGVRRCQAYVQK